MAESVSFKAYLKRDGRDVEVRRFGIDAGAATNYAYLRGKIQAMFPSIQNDEFNVFWQDSENDTISISSDEELLVALSSATAQPFKIYVQVSKQRQAQGGSSSSEQVHPHITCDGCEGPVVGRRFKCVTCPDFDLCSGCEATGLHTEHFMLRITSPFGPTLNPRLIRKYMSRPHKYFKHGWGHMGAGEGGCAPRGSCPFASARRGTEDPSANTARPGAAAPGIGAVTDMFDFSALMDFINNLGVSLATGRKENSEPTATASASASAQTQPSARPSQPTTSSAQESTSQGTQPPHPTMYLNNIGQAIAAILDPFGVDVSFEVRPKPSEDQEAPSAPKGTEGKATAPAQSASSTPASATPASTGAQTPRSESSPAPASVSQPVAEQPRQTSPVTTGRRNSDDWTMINRESPTRNIAMDVEDNLGARPRTVYPELPKEVTSAPIPLPGTGFTFTLPNPAGLTPPSTPADRDSQKLQEAIDRIRSMGFNFETSLLKELLRKENFDIASVIEKILTNKY